MESLCSLLCLTTDASIWLIYWSAHEWTEISINIIGINLLILQRGSVLGAFFECSNALITLP